MSSPCPKPAAPLIPRSESEAREAALRLPTFCLIRLALSVGWRLGLPVLGLFVVSGFSADWRMVPNPLVTRWAATVHPTNVHPEYPRPQLVRPDWLNLNGLWDYAITEASEPPPTNFDGSILVPFPVESALSGVGRRLWETNTLWYRRTVQIPADWFERRILLHFGAVDWDSRVFVNGRQAARHRGGYDPFSVEISSYLKRHEPNEILVAVQDPTEGNQPRGKQSRNPGGIFYMPSSGIWQTVWLEPVPFARIEGLRMHPDLDRSLLRLTVLANRINESFRVKVVALSNGVPVVRAEGPANSPLELKIEQPRLWSPADPFLYDLDISMEQNEVSLDRVTSYFGLRSLSVRRDAAGLPRLAFNGRFELQLGVLDQGFWPDGLHAAPADEAWREDLEMLKGLGFNTVRKHVKVEPQRWYYWCDRLGLAVWQDMPSGNNVTPAARQQFEIELQRMVENLGNHPSVVLWVLFNEGWGQYDTPRLTAWLKSFDPSRLVSSASGWIDKRTGDVVDIHSYPGPEAPAPDPIRAAVLGEFGGLGLAMTNHLWAPRTWSYATVQDTAELTARYAELLNRVWALHNSSGLSAAIYTQLSDVETECNGLVTYDRALVKINAESVRAANRGRLQENSIHWLSPTAPYGRVVWRYTTQPPGPGWARPGYDAGLWRQGTSAFGRHTFEASHHIRTEWSTPGIWLRRQFLIPSGPTATPRLLICHDAEAEVYLNGILAAAVKGQSAGYVEMPLSPAAAASLRPGNNLLAIHGRQIGTNQLVDAGLIVPAQRPGL